MELWGHSFVNQLTEIQGGQLAKTSIAFSNGGEDPIHATVEPVFKNLNLIEAWGTGFQKRVETPK